MRWLLALMLVAGVAEGQWPTATPTRTPRPTQPPAATATPRPSPSPTARPAATGTPAPASTPRPTLPPTSAGLNYYLVPMVPILTPAVGEPLRYADGTPFTIIVRLASGEILCQPVRVE